MGKLESPLGISIVILASEGRDVLFKACLREVLHQADSGADEILILANGLERSAVENLIPLNRAFRGIIQIIPIEKTNRSAIRNRAFLMASKTILCFVDDDAEIEKGYVSKLRRNFAKFSDLAILGGPNLTPHQNGFFQKASGAALTSQFAAPLVNVRYRRQGNQVRFGATEHDLILCALAVRRSLIPDGLRFRNGLRSNEENFFIHECRRLGLQIAYDPSLVVYHHRRDTLKGFVSQLHSYGRGRAQQLCLMPMSNHPLLILGLLGTVATFFILLFNPSVLWATVVGYAVLATLGAISSTTWRRLGPTSIAVAIPLTAVIHFGYLSGVYVGIFHRLVGKVFRPGYFLDPSRSSI